MCSSVDYCNGLIRNVFISLYKTKKKEEEKYRPLSNSLNSVLCKTETNTCIRRFIVKAIF